IDLQRAGCGCPTAASGLATTGSARHGQREGLLQRGGVHIQCVNALDEAVSLELHRAEDGRPAGHELVLRKCPIYDQPARCQHALVICQLWNQRPEIGGAKTSGVVPTRIREPQPTWRLTSVIARRWR